MWVGGSLLVLRTERERKREVCECVLLFFLASPSSSSFFLILPPPLPSSFLPRYRPMCAEGKRGGGEEVGSLAVTLGCSPSLPLSLLHSCAKVCLRSTLASSRSTVPRLHVAVAFAKAKVCEIRQRVHQTSKLTGNFLAEAHTSPNFPLSLLLPLPAHGIHLLRTFPGSPVRVCAHVAKKRTENGAKKTLRVYCCSVAKQPMETFSL